MLELITNHRFLVNFKKYKYLLFELTKRSIILKYRKSKLGILWSFLNPLLYMVVLTIIFSSFFGSDISNYPVYLLCGRLTFDFFSQGTKAAMGSIKSSNMIKKVYMPKYLQPLSRVLGAFVMFLISLIVLFLIMIATGTGFTIYALYAIIPIILLFLLVLGVGLTLSTVNVFIGDTKYFYQTLLTILMWTSAIFYPAETIPEKFQFILTYNPIYAVISMFRDCFLNGQMFGLFEAGYVLIISLIFIFIGVILLYKYQDKFILYM